MSIKDYLNLDAVDEIHTFMKSGKQKKITAKMKYDAFVKHSLQVMNPVMRSYLDEKKTLMIACTTVDQLKDLVIPALPQHMKDQIVLLVDKQKHLDLVEQTYLCLDLWRAVSGQVGETLARMAMHYAKALESAHIIRPNNGRIIIP